MKLSICFRCCGMSKTEAEILISLLSALGVEEASIEIGQLIDSLTTSLSPFSL